jgi:hypothetical protein
MVWGIPMENKQGGLGVQVKEVSSSRMLPSGGLLSCAEQ